MRTIRVLTRRSDLALKQVILPIIPLLGEHSRQMYGVLPMSYAIVPTDTIGDKGKFKDFTTIGTAPVQKSGSEKEKWFTELDKAIGNESGDLAVHSGKDVPPQIHSETTLYPILNRDDPRDVFISRHGATFADLPRGAKIGTNSTRRKAQLKIMRPDLIFADSYGGNVMKRIQFETMDERGVDGIILAAAGLSRLGSNIPLEIQKRIEPFSIETMLPCVNQAIVVVQCRKNDIELRRVIEQRLVHQDTLAVWQAERSALEATNADCDRPLAIHATLHSGIVSLLARAFSSDGRKVVERTGAAPTAEAKSLGHEIGSVLLERIKAESIWN